MASRASGRRTGKLQVFIVGLFVIGMPIGCKTAHAPMTNTVVRRAENPFSKTSALLIERSYKAALSNDQFYLILLSEGQDTNKAINDDGIADASALVATLAGKVQLRWQYKDTLVVICDGCGLEAVDISKKLEHLGSTKIIYQGFPLHTAYS